MAKTISLTQAQSIANAVIKKVKDKGYAVASDLGTLASLSEVAESNLDSDLAAKINGKADEATTLAGYGITDAYTKTEVDGKISATYRPAGTIAGNELTSSLLIAANIGFVYDISSDLSITSSNEGLFKNLSNGDKVRKGDNVAIVLADASYSEASGTAVEGTTYYELDEGEYKVVEITTGESVSGYYTKDADSYLFDDLTGFVDLSGVTYTAGDGVDISAGNVISAKIDSANANGLDKTSAGLKLGLASPDVYSGGTKQSDGAAGAMSSADKYKLDNADVTPYTAGNGVAIGDGTGGTTDHEVSVKIDTANARGLSATSSGLGLAAAVADTWGGVAATGTYVAGTTYYSDSACTTKVDTSDFVAGTTDVSSYYTLQKTADGTAGAISSADQYKLNSLTFATDTEIASMITGLDSLDSE